MNKNKLFIVINLMFFILISICNILLITLDGLLLKGITSGLFVILGIINLVFVLKNSSRDKRFPIIMMIGLFFAFLGDIVLELNFIGGAVLFAIGHILFFVSYCFIEKFNFKDLIIGAFIFVASALLITLVPCFEFSSVVLEVVAVIYALIISLMLGKAITNLIRNTSILNLLIVVGSVLFFFSDLMLLFNVFSVIQSVEFGILCLATYYPAEYLLAYSIYESKDEE